MRRNKWAAIDSREKTILLIKWVMMRVIDKIAKLEEYVDSMES